MSSTAYWNQMYANACDAALPSAMYRLGYQNANCIGCVKGGEGSLWNAGLAGNCKRR